MRFCERLRTLRMERGLTLAAMASEIGITTQGYKRLEDGEVGKTFEKIPRIARALGCSISDLFPQQDDEDGEASEQDSDEIPF